MGSSRTRNCYQEIYVGKSGERPGKFSVVFTNNARALHVIGDSIAKRKVEGVGISGRKIVEEKYSWEKFARDLETYLLSIDDVRAHAYNLLNIIPTCGDMVIGDVTFTPSRVS